MWALMKSAASPAGHVQAVARVLLHCYKSNGSYDVQVYNLAVVVYNAGYVDGRAVQSHRMKEERYTECVLGYRTGSRRQTITGGYVQRFANNSMSACVYKV